MDEVHEHDVSTLIKSFQKFAEKVKIDNGFSINNLINFMEPKFHDAGYRQQPQITCYSKKYQTKILILHDSGAGDFVINSGVIREIRRIYPDAYVTLLVKSNAIELAELCPYVDEVIENKGHFSYSSFYHMFEYYIEFAEVLLQRKFDICYSLAYLAETQLLMYMSGARVRISMNVYVDKTDEQSFSNTKFFNFKNTEKFSTNIVPRPQYRCHRVDMSFAILEYFLNAPIINRTLEVWYSPLEMAIVKSMIENAGQPLYALCMGGSHPRKFYPPEKYAKFIEMIVAKEKRTTFVILGAGKSDLKSAEILKNTISEIYKGNIIDLTNKTNYRQSAAILSLCDAYVGNDTGTMHLATAVKCPVLEINCHPSDIPIKLGNTIAVYYPYGVPNIIVRPKKALPECITTQLHNSYGCRMATTPHCITQISPQTLFDGLKYLKQRILEKNFKPLYVC